MRKLLFGTLLTAAIAAVPAVASAQQMREIPTLPELSPHAEVHQVVGITDVSIDYSSPAARDREIWGGLVPYGEVWRAGANAPTKLTVSNDFTFGGTEVPAGTYTLLIVPNEGSWAFHLNTDSSGRGAYGYDASEDVAVAEVAPMAGPERERLHFLFTNTTNDGTHLTLEWAGMTASVPLEIDTPGLALAAIEAELENAWRPPFNAARYCLDSDQDLDMAATWMAQSIAIEANWWNHWFMARIEAGRENYEAAREHATTAAELGAGNDTFDNFFAGQVEEALATWPES